MKQATSHIPTTDQSSRVQLNIFGNVAAGTSRTPTTLSRLRCARTNQGNWQPQRNRNFRELLSA
jgi:hypothetical protein